MIGTRVHNILKKITHQSVFVETKSKFCTLYVVEICHFHAICDKVSAERIRNLFENRIAMIIQSFNSLIIHQCLVTVQVILFICQSFSTLLHQVLNSLES